MPRVTIRDLGALKAKGERLVSLTAYDAPTARLAEQAGVDLLLVGDSLAMTVLGMPNTLEVTMDEMIHHCRAVVRGSERAHVVRAPGRVNLIGEHTDYNDGFVFPMAIEPEVRIVCRSRTDQMVRLASTAFPGQVVEFSLQSKIERAEPLWANYSRGVAAEPAPTPRMPP